MRLSKPTVALVVVVAVLMTAEAQETAEAQKPTVIEGRVVDATVDEAPLRHPVAVWYEESGIDHEPVSTSTGTDGKFRLDLPDNLGKFGLLYVREIGYNSAVLSWPRPADRDTVLRLTKPILIHGKLANASGVAVSGATLKWRMPFDFRLTSGTATAAADGSFAVLVPSKSDDLRLVAWADLYAPTEADFSYDGERLPITTLTTLEDIRGGAADRTGDPQYLQDWIDEILSQEPVAEPAPR